MKHDSEVLKDFLNGQPGQKEFGVRIPDKENVQVQNYSIYIVRKIGEESMHDVIIVDNPPVQGSS